MCILLLILLCRLLCMAAMLLSLLQPPSSCSLSVPCVSTTMCMVALLCYCASYNHLLHVLYQFPVSTTMCMVALLCYCPSYNHLLLVLYQFPVCPLQCACLLCYATVPLTTTFFWFSISSHNVHGCSAMLPSLLQQPSSGSLSVPCASTKMCMFALLCYCPSYSHLLLVLYQFPVCPLQCAWLLCYATVPLTTTFFWFSISSLCLLQCACLLCYATVPLTTTFFLFSISSLCPLQCAWLLCYATVPLTSTFFWFSISSLCVCYNEVNDLLILLNHHEVQHYV